MSWNCPNSVLFQGQFSDTFRTIQEDCRASVKTDYGACPQKVGRTFVWTVAFRSMLHEGQKKDDC